jgi:hypothetical protein
MSTETRYKVRRRIEPSRPSLDPQAPRNSMSRPRSSTTLGRSLHRKNVLSRPRHPCSRRLSLLPLRLGKARRRRAMVCRLLPSHQSPSRPSRLPSSDRRTPGLPPSAREKRKRTRVPPSRSRRGSRSPSLSTRRTSRDSALVLSEWESYWLDLHPLRLTRRGLCTRFTFHSKSCVSICFPTQLQLLRPDPPYDLLQSQYPPSLASTPLSPLT